MRTQLGVLALVTALVGPAWGQNKAPDVIPGEGWRLLRELTAAPFRFRIYQTGKERLLSFAVASNSAGRRDRGATLDDGYVGDAGLGGDPAALSVAAQAVDGRAADLFLIHVTTPADAERPATASHFLVRRERAKARLVCRLPDEPTQISILETTPALIFTASAGADSVRFIAHGGELCELQPPAPQSPDSARKLLFEATVAQAEMFRTAEAWKKAGDAFQRALHLRPTGRGAEWLARSAIDVRSSYNDLQWECTARRTVEELPIEGLSRLLLEAYDDYLSFFPITENAPWVRYRKAGMLEACNHFQAAAQQYQQVVDMSRDGELSEYARQGYERTHEMAERRDRSKPAGHSTNGAAAQPGVKPDGATPGR